MPQLSHLSRDTTDHWRQLEILEGLGHANLALSEIEQSKWCFIEVLEGAVRGGLTPQVLSALVGIAHLLADVEPERAVELVALALHHPATIQITKDRSQELFSQLESEMAPEPFTAATARGQARKLEEVAAEILGNALVARSPQELTG